MRLQKILLLLLCGSSLSGFAQSESTITTDVTKITFLNPGIGYEKSIGNGHTLHAQAFINASVEYTYSNSFGGDFSASFDPALLVQYRYYYNYRQRQDNGKRTEMNSMNYISPTFQTVLSKNRVSTDHALEMERRPINAAGVVWGLQRNYEKRFSLDLNLGLGYLFTTTTLQGGPQPVKENVGMLTMMGQLNLGFWLNKRD